MKIVGIAGYSGAGKTTLIDTLLAEFGARGLSVLVVKQSHHDVDLDPAGKDSWRHRRAGAHEVLLTSPHRWMLAAELRRAPEPAREALLARLSACDLVVVEGYRHADLPKLEVHRQAAADAWLYPADPHVLAVASDEATDGRPCFGLGDVAAIADFIWEHARRVER